MTPRTRRPTGQYPRESSGWLVAELQGKAATATSETTPLRRVSSVTCKQAPIGRRPTGRLRRRVRLETVPGHHLGSHACKPSVGSPRGAGWRPGPLQALPSGTDHAAARRDLIRAGRSRVRRRLATVVKDEFDAFRECGLLAHGFPRLLRVQLQPRRLCPLCGPRRMSQTAAHLVNHGIPHVPVR